MMPACRCGLHSLVRRVILPKGKTPSLAVDDDGPDTRRARTIARRHHLQRKFTNANLRGMSLADIERLPEDERFYASNKWFSLLTR